MRKELNFDLTPLNTFRMKVRCACFIEYDSEEEMITALPDGTFIMRGLTPLEDAEDAAGIPFTEEEKDEFDTLNGFLISRADRIPADGERFTVRAYGYEFRILNVQTKMIRSVKVSWIGEEDGKETEKAEKAEKTAP